MKNFPGAFRFVLVAALALVAVLAFQAVAKEKGHSHAKPVFELCITEPIVVTDPEGLKKALKKIDKSFYKIRIEEAGKPPYEDGDLPECSVSEKTMAATEPPTPAGTPSAGAQSTQRLKLTAQQLRTITAYLGESVAPSETPTPTPKP